MSSKRRTSIHVDRPVHSVPGQSRRQRVLYVGVEGESTEPDYLDHLNREFGAKLGFTIHVLRSGRGLKPREVVQRVLAEREHDKEGEFWAVFDRDQHDGIPQAYADAATHGVQVAFSHPSFDLWLLLHFTAFSGAQSGSNEIVHEKLRRIPEFETFGRRNKSLRGRRAAALLGNEDAAAARARKLADDCPNRACNATDGHAEHCDPLCRDPSTDMWRLLATLTVIDG